MPRSIHRDVEPEVHLRAPVCRNVEIKVRLRRCRRKCRDQRTATTNYKVTGSASSLHNVSVAYQLNDNIMPGISQVVSVSPVVVGVSLVYSCGCESL